MKKIVLAMAAVAAIGVAGCKSNNDAGANAADLNATANAADADVNASANEADQGNAVTATQNEGAALGNDAGRAVAASGNAVESGADAVAGAAHNATH